MNSFLSIVITSLPLKQSNQMHLPKVMHIDTYNAHIHFQQRSHVDGINVRVRVFRCRSCHQTVRPRRRENQYSSRSQRSKPPCYTFPRLFLSLASRNTNVCRGERCIMEICIMEPSNLINIVVGRRECDVKVRRIAIT